MNVDERNERPANSLNDASFLSKLTYAWAWPLLKLGWQQALDEYDLPALQPHDKSVYNRSKIERLLRKGEDARKNNSLARALLWDYLRSTWVAQLMLVINMVFRIAQAFALGLLMEQFGRFDEEKSEREFDAKKAYLFAGIVVLCGLIAFPSKQQQFFHCYRVGMRTRIGLVAAIYAKTLRLPSVSGTHSTTSGYITNLASNDVERFLTASVSFLFLLYSPVFLLMILFVGIFVAGKVFLVSYGLLFLLIPFQLYLGRRFSRARRKIALACGELVVDHVACKFIVKYNVPLIANLNILNIIRSTNKSGISSGLWSSYNENECLGT